jgi:hypothetical protein
MRFRAADLRPPGRRPPQTLHIPDWCGCSTEYLPVGCANSADDPNPWDQRRRADVVGSDLFRIIAACKENLPITHIHMLSNGRRFAEREYAASLSHVRHPDFGVGIPLHADVASHDDFVVQAAGAFDQTMVGFHNLARNTFRNVTDGLRGQASD